MYGRAYLFFERSVKTEMKLIIVGASGHGKVVADVAGKNGYDDIKFLDDFKFNNPDFKQFCEQWPIVGNVEALANFNDDLFIAIGNSKARKNLIERYSNKHIVTLIHPDATIASNVKIGIGTVIMAGAIINPATRIGNGCIINTSSSVDHDCIIGDYSHVAVGAHLADTVSIGQSTWIGAGATVSNNVKIFDNCMIGAGAVVVKDITEAGTYIGVPAKKIK